MPKWPAWVLFGVMGACTYPAITAPPPEAPPPVQHQQAYRALGTEPFWSVRLEHGQMIYEDAEQRRIEVINPRHRTTFNGHRYDSQRLTLDISRGECSDGMSDNVYADTVLVIADGRELRGCGGAVTPPVALAGTRWRITDVNGDDVSGESNYMLRFDADGLSGRAGCNSLSAAYGVAGDRLQVAPITSTRMACPGPRMRHEQFVTGLLRSTPRIAFQGDRVMVLSGGGGFIRLQRAD